MFEILGYLVSLIIIAFAVTLLTEYMKRFKFISNLVKYFDEKIKKVSWYQVETMIIAFIILIILNLLGAISIGILSMLLNAVVIGFLSNGIFTYKFVKDLLLKLKLVKIIEVVEPKKTTTPTKKVKVIAKKK